ncbi:MAG TPA: DegV family EDD domain-containing protein [Gemmatimonadetes bacterium]|nr:DegV family EDD domain-containing protein [Gemmatimonadota bacterium]
MKIGYIDGPRLRRALSAGCEWAKQQRGELNRINVFPVPDGDTGTNLYLTVQAISDHLEQSTERSVGGVAQGAAQAAVLGARGNCGMMLSHFLLGFAKSLEGQDRIGATGFGGALEAGVQNLSDALEAPVEGTILTVMRDTAQAVSGAGIDDIAPLAEHMLDRARDSLERTPELLPVLSAAGVVDAGAKGFVSLLEGVVMFLRGDPLVPESGAEFIAGPPVLSSVEYPERVEQFQFCTEALVRGGDLPDQATVRGELRTRGDSLIVIRSDDVLKVHIHTDEPEDVFSYLKGLGNLVTHKAEDMKAQYDAAERASSSHLALTRRPVGVLTDSAADLPEEIVRAHGIQVVPMMVVDGDDVYRDGVDLTAEQFHEMLASQDRLPTTSQPSPASFLEGFKRASADAEQVVAVMVSSGLSGTYRSAEAAASQEPDLPIHLADSRGASLLQGLLVLKATELAEMAVPADEIVTELGRIRDQSGLLFTVETFDRLLASGRVSRSQAFFANLLNVKPILSLDHEGKVVPLAKAFGRKRVIMAVLDTMAQEMGRVPERVRFGIIHVGIPGIVPEVRELLVERYGDVEILNAPITPVVATHLGIGAWGIAYMVEDPPDLEG